MAKEEEIFIPKEVVDKEAYLEWVSLFEKWKKDPRVFQKTSDPNTSLNMLASSYIVRKHIQGLPDEEQKKFLALHEDFNKVKGKLAVLKRKAFGTVIKGTKSTNILDNKQPEIFELFGKFYDVTEVHNILINEFKLPCSWEAVRLYKERYKEKILELQEKYKKDYGEIRLTHKKSRLEELQELYIDRKLQYKTSKHREDYRLLLATMEQVKREVEGDLVVTGNLKFEHRIEQTLVEHINQELLRGLIIKEIILSRVASKTNINPSFLLSRLSNSLYSKFTGFQPIEGDINDEEPIYPSKITYDFEEIRNKAIKYKEDRKVLEKLPDIEDIQTIDNLKEELINKIKNKKRVFNESQDLIGKYKDKRLE